MIYSLNEILLYIILYSFLGWLIEVTFISILNKKVIHRGKMIGPFLSKYTNLIYYFNYYNVFMGVLYSLVLRNNL